MTSCTDIQSKSQSLAKEVQTNDELRKERDALRQQLDAIRKIVLEEPTIDAQNQNTRQKVLSYLNLNRLDTLVENSHSSDDSASNNGIEFDKTDEEVLNERSKHSFVTKRKSDHRESSDNIDSNNAYMDNALSPKRNRVSGMGCAVTDEQMNIEVIDDQELYEANQKMGQKEEIDGNKQQMPKPSRISRIRAHMITVAVLNEFGSLPFNSPSQMTKTASQTSISNRLDNRIHDFVKKKALRYQKCDPCGKRIVILNDCYKCRDCFATCHVECRDKVPVPCILFDKPRLIADYVAYSDRPAIPAQIVKLCSEIEKRGLDEEGLYRIPGSIDIVNQLCRDMFRSKKSLPSLSSSEVKVLCSVLKKFLIGLKEPLVTRILWHDFVQASEQKNMEDEQRLIKQSISELPTANRDTLAFLMVHLQRIAKSKAMTKMDDKNIATVLGPTIIGHSSPDLPYVQIMAEFKPQTKVMESLLRMSEDYWNSVVSINHSLQTTRLATGACLSIGTRLFGGTNVQSGILTPIQVAATLSRGHHRLKPLF